MTRTKAVITNEGLVSLNVPTIIESSCKIRVDNYPFDKQNCELKFGSWTYDAAGIALILEVHCLNKMLKCYFNKCSLKRGSRALGYSNLKERKTFGS